MPPPEGEGIEFEGSLGVRQRVWAIVGVVVVALGVFVALAARPSGDLPFDSARWKANPASGWVSDSVRYRMRMGALKAVKRCRTSDEVTRLLGEPEADGDYAKGGKDTDPSHAYTYLLGDIRHPVRFWQPGAVSTFDVSFDRSDRMLDASISNSPTD
jgi:hypothetical protein